MRIVEQGQDSANLKLLVLTTHANELDIRRALQVGVPGYILVDGPLNDLIDAVTTLSSGGRYLARAVAQRLADSATRQMLTMRETQVLQLLIVGESNKSIGRQLGIEVGTVKSHINAIMGKLDATSRTQAAAIAITRGIVAKPSMPTPAMPRRAHRGGPVTLAS